MSAALPQFNILVNLQVIKSCKVTSFDTNGQSFDSLTLEVGDQITLPFISFKQLPDCSEVVSYSITLMEKVAEQNLDFNAQVEGQAPGQPSLAILTANSIEIDASDDSLSGKSFTVFVKGIA